MEFNITSTDITYVIFAIVAVIVAFLIIKKVAGCLIKAVVFAILVAILGYIYYNFSMVEE
jgi:hypothetical protein